MVHPPFMAKSPESQNALDILKVVELLEVWFPFTRYALVVFIWVIPDGPCAPLIPLLPGWPCIPWIPWGPVAPVAPGGPGGPWVPVWLLSLLLSFLSSNLTCLQNSTELTKNPSNGPVLHSYFLSSVGIWL